MLFDKYTDKADVRDRAIKLYQISLCKTLSSHKASKRNLLLLYLLGNHYATRYQLMRLLSYEVEASMNLYDYLDIICRGKVIKRYITDDKNYYFDIFILESNGLSEATTLFKECLQSILSQQDPYYSSRVNELLGEEYANIDFIADFIMQLSINSARGNKVRHLVATNDCYLSLLQNFPPACLPFSDSEVEFNVGMIRKRNTSFNNRTDIRSDAVHLLPVRLIGKSEEPENESVIPVCIEQDTMHQNSSVLLDKVARYIDLVFLPRLERYHIPPVIVFSILPFRREKKDEKETRSVPYRGKARTGVLALDEIRSYASLLSYATDKSEGDISLSDLSAVLKHISVGRGVSYYDKTIKALDKIIEDYGAADVPVNQIERFEKCSIKDTNAIVLTSSHPTYVRRRNTIFTMLSGISTMREIADMGFSICAMCNYEPASVLSFFSAFFADRLMLGDGNQRPVHVPFYRLSFSDGEEIKFRNMFRVGSAVYAIDNIMEDYCGRLRLESVIRHDTLPDFYFVAVVSKNDFAEAVDYLSKTVPDEWSSSILICSFDSFSTTNYSLTRPQPFKRFCI